MHIVFACPYHLDGTPHLLRQHNRIHDEIEVAIPAPAEAAAHQEIVQLHLFARDVEELGRRLGSRGLALSAGPDLDRIARGRDGGNPVYTLPLGMITTVATGM